MTMRIAAVRSILISIAFVTMYLNPNTAHACLRGVVDKRILFRAGSYAGIESWADGVGSHVSPWMATITNGGAVMVSATPTTAGFPGLPTGSCPSRRERWRI